MSFKDLKRNSNKSLQILTEKINKMNTSSFQKDERLWSCQTDKMGNGYAIIRFLPGQSVEDDPFVRIWSHGFKGPGGWYIENSLTTLGMDDPVAEMNTQLWNQGEGSPGRARVQGQGRDEPGTKRQLNYYSCVYIVKDPANPENEGQVKLFRYGAKIFEKLSDAMHPTFPGEEPIDPFDLWNGANFVLKIRRVKGYANFDLSEFEKPGPLASDEEMEKIYNQIFSLKELVAPDKFKSYDDLKKRLDRVLGNTASKPAQNTSMEDDDVPFDTGPKHRSAPAPSYDAEDIDDDEDDIISKFRSLADED